MNENDPFFSNTSTYDVKGGLTAAADSGIQVRDAVALHCLQGLLANPKFKDSLRTDQNKAAQSAKIAYEFADALIEESQPKPEPKT